MPDYFSAAEDLLGGFSDFFGGQAAAKGAQAAGNQYRQAAAITQQSTQLKELQAARNIYQVQGSAQAITANAGLQNSGSAADIMRSNAQQGALSKSIIENQGRITEQAYLGQAYSADLEAKAADQKSKGGLFGGILGAAASIFGL